MKLSTIIILALLAISAPALAINVYTCDARTADLFQGEIIPGTATVANQAALVTATESQFMSVIGEGMVKSPILNSNGFASINGADFLMQGGKFSYRNEQFIFVLDNCVKVKS